MYQSIQPYTHKTQYYETDQMGVVHHSNYIRWFEEARVDIMEQLQISYDVMEAHGIVSPVIGITSQYKSMVRFPDIVIIDVKVLQYNGAKLTLGYTIIDRKSNIVRCIGESRHCFLNKDSKLVSLARVLPDFDEIFRQMLLS